MSEHNKALSSLGKGLLIGAGAVGSFYAGKLIQAGADIDFLCRSDVDHIKSQGVSVKSPLGDFSFSPTRVLDHKDFILDDDTDIDTKKSFIHYDFIILATKVLAPHQTEKLLSPFVAKETIVYLFQNGIFVEKPLQERFPETVFVSVLAFVCLNRIGPGLIHHLDYGPLEMGVFPSGELAHSKAMCEIFQSLAIKCRYSESIQNSRWIKLVWNAPFNPLSVVEGEKDTGELLSDPVIEKRIRQIMQEVVDLAALDGYLLKPDVIDQKIDQTKKMAPYKTSMLVDYQAGKSLESDAILGNAIRFAKKYEKEVPYLTQLYHELKNA